EIPALREPSLFVWIQTCGSSVSLSPSIPFPPGRSGANNVPLSGRHATCRRNCEQSTWSILCLRGT
ncbi:hypothetical protein NDU88_001157, partial [Pleurodeles waltl]